MDYPTGRDYFTPEEMEAVKAASKADEMVSKEVMQRRYERAVSYLDDGKWIIYTKYAWKRSYDGKKLTFLIDRDRYNLAEVLTKESYWGTGAFSFLFTIFHETIDGFGENEIKKLQRTRKPRRSAEPLSPKATLYIKKLNPKLLAVKEQRWNDNEVPPKEVLEQMVQWDDYLKMLFKISPERDTTEYVFDDNFVELNGEMYAIWRVRSMLMFGNQEGHATNERWSELLAAHPKSETPLIIPETSVRGIRKRVTISERKERAIERAQISNERKKIAQAGMTRAEKVADNMLRSKNYEARALALLKDRKIAEEADHASRRRKKSNE